MDHQAVRRHGGRVGEEAGRNHEPANGALQSAKEEENREPGNKPALDPRGGPQPEHWEQENHADEAAPEAVGPFEPEDVLEAGEAEAFIDQLVLRDFLVEGEET